MNAFPVWAMGNFPIETAEKQEQMRQKERATMMAHQKEKQQLRADKEELEQALEDMCEIDIRHDQPAPARWGAKVADEKEIEERRCRLLPQR